MPYKNIEDQRKRKREYARERRQADPTYGKAAHLWHMYRLRIEDYEAMLLEQGHRCALCRTDVVAYPKAGDGHHPKRACVDHCHTAGVVRGILCAKCNSAIGYFRDDTTVLQRAITYLQKYQPKGDIS